MTHSQHMDEYSPGTVHRTMMLTRSRVVSKCFCVKERRLYDSVDYSDSPEDIEALQVGDDVTTSRCALACCSPTLHTYSPASPPRARLTIRIQTTTGLHLEPRRIQDPFRRSTSEEHLKTTSPLTSNARLHGRAVSFVDDGRVIVSIVITAVSSINCAMLVSDFIVQPQHRCTRSSADADGPRDALRQF